MSESYKIREEGLHFLSFAVVGWLDVFTRRIYQDILVDSIIFCQNTKGLELYCYCIMPNHLHLIANNKEDNLTNFLRSFKSFTAKAVMNSIEQNLKESRRELFMHQFKYYGSKHKKAEMQFWKHDNHPIYLYSNELIDQKVNYIHKNPVEAGFVTFPHEWRLSSASENSPIKVLPL